MPDKTLLKHIVMFALKPSVSDEIKQKIETEFCKLKHKIDEVIDLEWGQHLPDEKRNQGFTHCFTLTYESESALQAYHVHPDHVAFVSLLKPNIDNILIFDYWPSQSN